MTIRAKYAGTIRRAVKDARLAATVHEDAVGAIALTHIGSFAESAPSRRSRDLYQRAYLRTLTGATA